MVTEALKGALIAALLEPYLVPSHAWFEQASTPLRARARRARDALTRARLPRRSTLTF